MPRGKSYSGLSKFLKRTLTGSIAGSAAAYSSSSSNDAPAAARSGAITGAIVAGAGPELIKKSGYVFRKIRGKIIPIKMKR